MKVLERAATANGTEPLIEDKTMVRGNVPTVRILESFSNEIDFNIFVHKMASLHQASIVLTKKEVLGKQVRKYLAQHVMPPGAVVVSCHPKKNCSHACDDR